MNKVERMVVVLLLAFAFVLAAVGIVQAQTYTAPGAPTGAVWGQTNPEANQPDYWCEPGMGVKYEPVATPFVVPVPEEGKTWTLLVLKGGTTNEVILRPVVGQGYSHSEHDNSHVILCWEVEQVTTTTSTSSTTTSSTTSTSTSTTTSSTSTTSTTTTDPTTTSSSTTTTVVDQTTTSSSVPDTTTTAPSSTVPPTTTTSDTLPVTGIEQDMRRVALVALVFIAVGMLVLAGAWALGARRIGDTDAV